MLVLLTVSVTWVCVFVHFMWEDTMNAEQLVIVMQYLWFLYRFRSKCACMSIKILTDSSVYTHISRQANAITLLYCHVLITCSVYMLKFTRLCFSSSDKSTWEHIGICKSYGARSSPMWCASCSVSGAGSTANCPTSTVLHDLPDLTRPADWDTRPSRVSTRSYIARTCSARISAAFLTILSQQATSSTVSVCAAEAVNAPCPKVPPTASQCTTVSTRWNLPAAFSLLLR